MHEEEQVFDEETFYAAFAADLNQARGQVLIMSSYLTTRQLEHLKGPIKECVARNVRVCVFLQEDRYWKQRKEFPKPRLRDVEDAIQQLESMRVHVTLLQKVHVKIIIVDEDIFWFGTMNILSHFDTIERMERSRNRRKVEEAIRKYRLDLCSPCVCNSPLGAGAECACGSPAPAIHRKLHCAGTPQSENEPITTCTSCKRRSKHNFKS